MIASITTNKAVKKTKRSKLKLVVKNPKKVKLAASPLVKVGVKKLGKKRVQGVKKTPVPVTYAWNSKRLRVLFNTKKGRFWKKRKFFRIAKAVRKLFFQKNWKNRPVPYKSLSEKRKLQLNRANKLKLNLEHYKYLNYVKINSPVSSANVATWNKTKVTTYDKLFYYYTVKTPMSLYAHKAFILLEMQLNASLVRMKLVPYLFLVNELCFYRIVHLNNAVINSPYHVLSLYDNVSIPVALYNYMYYRQYRVQRYPRQLARFFKRYWMQFTNYNQNKTWLLTNFLVSNITAEAMVFDYPNIVSYMSPFRRFTRLYYRNQPYTEIGAGASLAYTHIIIKLKLFTYAAFYK